MKKENTINEAEARDIIHAKLTEQGEEITKTLLDKVLDMSKDLAIAGLAKGQGIKLQGLGTIEVRTHQATTAKVPTTQNADGSWNFNTVDVPAGKHIAIEVSDSYLNTTHVSVQELR